MITDEELLVGYARGDQHALAELIRRYQKELYAFLARFVCDGPAAEDLFQETFIQVHRNAGTFDAARRFRPWLFTIAANKARDYLRASSRHNTRSLDSAVGRNEDAPALVDLMDSGNGPPAGRVIAGRGCRRRAEKSSPSSLAITAFEGPGDGVTSTVFAYQGNGRHACGFRSGLSKAELHSALAAFAKGYKELELHTPFGQTKGAGR